MATQFFYNELEGSRTGTNPISSEIKVSDDIKELNPSPLPIRFIELMMLELEKLPYLWNNTFRGREKKPEENGSDEGFCIPALDFLL